ncbi:uncharacterized protein [Diadema setosum]|uniref:uncharacterized protein isoform X2 n=1 Tax=Diadema setosum TaxID=31175 RepID=UPI003B3B367B
MGRRSKKKTTRGRAYYVPPNIQCRRNLWRLMGSEVVDLTSARYMDALAERVIQDYEEKLLERERELAQNEVRRERDLIIRGLMPDPDENKKRLSGWRAPQRRRYKEKSKDTTSSRPRHRAVDVPEGMSPYQQKIFCSSNLPDFVDQINVGLPSKKSNQKTTDALESGRTGTTSKSSRRKTKHKKPDTSNATLKSTQKQLP